MTRIIAFIIFFSSCWRHSSSTYVIGVSPNRLPLYDVNKAFTCLDGSKVIRFSSVNDDYCDCTDGSDEPGTSACPNGRFFCRNNGYLAILLPSSRVNDGICDCCDGTDEYNKEGLCPDNCLELGREYREEKKKEKEIFDQAVDVNPVLFRTNETWFDINGGTISKNEFHEGVALRQDLSQQGKQKKEERLKEVEGLQKEADEKKLLVDQLKAQKESAEALESEAKDKHDKEWDEIISKLKAERELELANTAFSTLDRDESGSITIQELTTATILDKLYNEEEAKELVKGQDTVDKELFVTELWNSTFKDIFNKTEPEDAKPDDENLNDPPPTEVSPPAEETTQMEGESEDDEDKDLENLAKLAEQDDDDVEDNDDDDDDDNDDDEVEPPIEPAEPEVDDGLPKKPDYNEETKKLIEDADKLRQEFSEVSKQKDDVLQKLADIDRLSKTDMGEHEEFAPLQDQCFEFDDREYTYKVCPFDKASQSSKTGASEVSLGTWGEWSGSPNKYSEMKFTNGLGCWNGPNRSTTVKLNCGNTNELVGVSEPNKCEYEFIFKTPAACHPDSFVHDEF